MEANSAFKRLQVAWCTYIHEVFRPKEKLLGTKNDGERGHEKKEVLTQSQKNQ